VSVEEDEFRDFYAGSARELSRAAFFLTGDVERAEELLQEALVRTAVHWRSVRRQPAPEAYVRKVMLNAVRSKWRRSRRLTEYPTGTDVEQESDENVEAAVLDREEFARKLRSLPPRQRAVLYLRYYLDLSVAESAELLGCSVGTVKSQSYDALRRLRSQAVTTDPDQLREVRHD
jgi:RNA polymerase sigma-70 factor (sigma-E family)